jgi:hypothetical protein
MPSMMNLFSEPLAPSIWMPPAYDSWLAPGAVPTTDRKSRPRGIFSMMSLLIVANDALCFTSMSGDSPVTSTISVSPPTCSVRSIFSSCPRANSASDLWGVNPSRTAVIV